MIHRFLITTCTTMICQETTLKYKIIQCKNLVIYLVQLIQILLELQIVQAAHDKVYSRSSSTHNQSKCAKQPWGWQQINYLFIFSLIYELIKIYLSPFLSSSIFILLWNGLFEFYLGLQFPFWSSLAVSGTNIHSWIWNCTTIASIWTIWGERNAYFFWLVTFKPRT